MASNQAKVLFLGEGVCFRQRGPRRKWPSWPSALGLNPPLGIRALNTV